MYTAEEIKEKQTLARAVGLSGADLFDDAEFARRSCNGIGSARMAAPIRRIIGALNPTLILAADIHDLRYTIGGSEWDRRFADEEFLKNGLLLADHRYAWYDPRRCLVRLQARKFFSLLRTFGAAAWKGDAA